MKLFVETFTLKALFFIFFKFILLKKNITEIHYINNSLYFSKIYLFFISKKIPIKKLDFDYFKIKNEKGTLIWLILQHFEYDKITDAILEKNKKHYYSNDKYLNIFIKKKIASIARQPSIIRKLYLINVINDYLKDSTKKEVIIIFDDFTWSNYVKQYGKKFNFEVFFIIQFSIVNIKEILKNFTLIQFLYHTFNNVINIIKHVKTLIRFKNYTNIDNFNNEIKIMIKSMGLYNLDKPYLHSDSTFLIDTNLNKKNIIFCERQTLKTKNKDYNDIKNLGYGFVKFKELAIQKKRPSIYKEINSSNLDNKSKIYYKNSLKEFSVVKENYISLFKKTNTKIHYTSWKYTTEHIALHAAINELGGFSAIWQQSYEEVSQYDLLISADIYFAFTKSNFLLEKKQSSFIKNHIVTGYPGDYRFKLLKNRSSKLRKELKEGGAEFILSFFDESSSSDRRYVLHDDYFVAQHTFLLEKVLEDKTLGVIFKPKKPQNILPKLDKNLVQEALNTKRCVFLLADTNHIPPAMAAMASDLAVHEMIYAGTAGIECALSKTPTIMLDKENWIYSDLYKQGFGKVLFPSISEMWSHINNIKLNLSENLKIWDQYLYSVDPYRDGKSNSRISEYLNDLVLGFEKKLNPDEILYIANKNFTDKWGQDKISNM